MALILPILIDSNVISCGYISFFNDFKGTWFGHRGLKLTGRTKENVLPKSKIVLPNTKYGGHSVLPEKCLVNLNVLMGHAFVFP